MAGSDKKVGCWEIPAPDTNDVGRDYFVVRERRGAESHPPLLQPAVIDGKARRSGATICTSVAVPPKSFRHQGDLRQEVFCTLKNTPLRAPKLPRIFPRVASHPTNSIVHKRLGPLHLVPRTEPTTPDVPISIFPLHHISQVGNLDGRLANIRLSPVNRVINKYKCQLDGLIISQNPGILRTMGPTVAPPPIVNG